MRWRKGWNEREANTLGEIFRHNDVIMIPPFLLSCSDDALASQKEPHLLISLYPRDFISVFPSVFANISGSGTVDLVKLA